MKEEIICPKCHTTFAFTTSAGVTPQYCPFCRSALDPADATTMPMESQKDTSTIEETPSVSFLTEHLPKVDEIRFSIGPYQVLDSIGKGGMGEVFLAYDTTCGRRLALKQIRPDLLQHKQLHNRFLKEARITSQLTHPAIIPIYAIHGGTDLAYYTMPYVEGETLKQLMRKARQNERKGIKAEQAAESIPALIRIFLSICQAVAYAHTKNVLHRDLKPENIIVGQYGQIVILDWGLAKLIKVGGDEELEIEEVSHPHHHLTHIGKVVGTVAYMSPERAMGKPATFQTDIYSLGVILYQLLTLKHPFHRESLKKFRQTMHLEKILEPSEVAPYRDVPKSLSRVVMKCLAPSPEYRYQSVDELIHDLENYIEGRSEWFQIAELDINNKSDWEFQENVLIAEHMALSHESGASDWVSLMIAKASFQTNIKLEALIKIGDRGHGIGFLLSLPEAAERTHLNDGYCLWIGAEGSKSTKLLRSTVEVMHASDVSLKRHEWYRVRIEKIENNIHFYLNDILQFSYISHLPLAGTHVGLIARDADFTLKDFLVYIGSQNVTVNCLAVPDAFLAHKNYAVALNEYRRIGYSFPGRAEGREAMFRAGITLLEQANVTTDSTNKEALYDLAHEEFHKLHNTPGAPLEYLGKALIYQALGEYEEEAKCFELGYRRYPNHPLLPVLQEQIVYRMHDSSRHSRQATFNFILLVLRYLPHVTHTPHAKKLLNSLERHWEPLPFILHDPDADTSEELRNLAFALKLAFWLAKPYVLSEMVDELLQKEQLHAISISNAIFCLIELGAWKLALEKLELAGEIFAKRGATYFNPFKELFEMILLCYRHSPPENIHFEAGINAYIEYPHLPQAKYSERVLLFFMEKALDARKTDLVHLLYQHSLTLELSTETELQMRANEIWALLLDDDSVKAGDLLHSYSLELLSQETTILHFLYGCWLYMTEGKEIASIHFSGVYEVPYPRSWALFSYYLKGKILEGTGWFVKSFLWEKRQLYRQLSLYYHCIDDKTKALHYQQQAQKAVIHL